MSKDTSDVRLGVLRLEIISRLVVTFPFSLQQAFLSGSTSSEMRGYLTPWPRGERPYNKVIV